MVAEASSLVPILAVDDPQTSIEMKRCVALLDLVKVLAIKVKAAVMAAVDQRTDLIIACHSRTMEVVVIQDQLLLSACDGNFPEYLKMNQCHPLDSGLSHPSRLDVPLVPQRQHPVPRHCPGYLCHHCLVAVLGT